MNDENYYEWDSAFDDDSHDNISESGTQILVLKTLINLVQPNLILYQKKHKHFNNKSMKMQIWNNIGASLIPPMPGINAEKLFYRLRQKFGKERRKVTQSQARSGAGSDHVPYTSNWTLYKDLMFLADHIQPRQTSSNFQPSILKRKKDMASQMSHFSNSQLSRLPLDSSQYAISTPATYPSICTPPASEESSDVVWNINLCESLDSKSLTENEKASVADSMESASSVSLSNSSVSQGIASTSMQKAIVSSLMPQKVTPPPDNTKKRKRQTSDEVDIAMLESSKNISSLANTLEIAFKKNITSTVSQPVKAEVSTGVENMTSGIALGLSKVREEHQIDCFISILACINDFIKK